MQPRRNYRRSDRVHISPAARAKAGQLPTRGRLRSMMAILVVAGTLPLFWGLSKWVQASSEAVQATGSPRASAEALGAATDTVEPQVSEAVQIRPTSSAGNGPVQGPAVDVPREILEMLDLRKKELDRREELLRAEEERLMVLKAEIEQIVTKHEQAVEAAEKRRVQEQEQRAKATQERKAQEDQRAAERREAHQRALAKMYEAMEPEEAAARLEKLPDPVAVAVLRLLRGKAAGAILAQVKPARAAKLTEQLLATP